MARPAALHESALSPQEYDEYSGLTRAFESSFPSTSRLPPQEVWEWLLQWLGQADSRTEKEVRAGLLSTGPRSDLMLVELGLDSAA